jgi:hypothetical protein
MGTAFYRGQQLGRGDLSIYFTNASGTPSDAAEISYAIFDFTTGQEVLVGSSQRVGANPSVGEYYASIIIPLDANLGSYRIRWTFRELIGAPIQRVVQEFEVIDKVTSTTTTTFSSNETDLIRRLRILLRDNCVGEEEEVELDVDGEKMIVSMGDLWDTLHDLNP